MLLHYFNPGYESGLLPGKKNYTPPRNVMRMRRDLAMLPLWYGEPEDYVWTEGETNMAFFNLPDDFPALPTLLTPALWENKSLSFPPLKATPWGLSPQSIRFFHELAAVEGRQLEIPEWKDTYLTLTGRQTAAGCLDKMRSRTNYPLPETPLFFSSVTAVEDYLQAHPSPFVLKMPYSSSGRGLLRVEGQLPEKEKEWLTGALRRQGAISIEPRLQKEKDFALEFYITPEGKAEYKGISIFHTEGWKTYCGNVLQIQPKLEELLSPLNLQFIINHLQLTTVLEETFGGKYSGYLGVDMIFYTDIEGTLRIHPCIEINMRYTMGMVAIRLFERFIAPEAVGSFYVTYEPNAWQRHQEMLQSHPATYENGRLLKGYLPLCPIGPETNYWAYILISISH